jgi:hypothetical protein
MGVEKDQKKDEDRFKKLKVFHELTDIMEDFLDK